MKKTLWALLCLMIMLSGCQTSSSQPVETRPIPTEAPPTQIQTEPSRLPLLEQGTVLGENSNLLYIPNQTVEHMVSPEVRLFGHGLLFSECIEDKLVLKHISLDDGSPVSEGSVTAASGAKLYIGSGEVGICDRGLGQISILDEQFRPLRAYDVPGEGDDWYLNSELDTLYIFFYDRGLLARNLVTREDRWLVDNGFRVTPVGSTNGYVIFEYTDRADQKTYTRCLNLSTATMETLPVGGTVSSGIRQGETWLLQRDESDGFYTVVKSDSANCFTWTDSAIRLLSPKSHLLVTDPSTRNLSLYKTDGTFLSSCSLPASSNAVVGSDFVWSGYWEGYFFVDFVDSSCCLMFWDVSAATEGENLPMSSPEQPQQSQTVLERKLYERAEELSGRFGVDIRIAEQCSLDYSHYDTYALTDPVLVRSALDVLEETLSLYPEGFFRQLPYGSIESIRIELVGGLTVKTDVTTHTDDAGAFAQDLGSYYIIVLDGYLLQQQTLFHEFSHIIDARLEWDSLIREDALYSEDVWMSLQPEGFHYATSYTEIPGELLPFMESGYFITDYALTYPTEDRALLMESAMNQYTWDFEPESGTRRKLQYYADCIRDCFDTEGWPETALWEQVLKQQTGG